jgi:hypothetical protein
MRTSIYITKDSQHKVHLVGNVMIDTLVYLLPRAEKHWPALKEN